MKKAFVLFLFFSIKIIVAQTTDRFSIKNVNINTKNNEFGTILIDDGSVFYSKSTFDNSKDFNEKSANLYKGVLQVKGQISKGLKFPTDATHAVFTSNGRTVYYSKKSGNKNFQLFRAGVDNTGRWKNNVKLPFNDPNYTFKQPALNNDNTKLFFTADIPGSFGKTDIYYVKISNNGLEYSDPINVGENVNTSGVEIYPFIGKKDKLFFSSDSHNGMGGFDIFESFAENGNYVNTSNLESPINSPSDDFAYVLIPNTNKGYISSNRKDGIGGVDIYYFEDRKPSLNKCSQAINGVVKNKRNKKAIFEASVEVFSTQDHMGTVLTNYKGEFLIENIECDERYDIVSYKEGFNGFAEVQTIPENGKLITLYLDPEFPEGYEEEFDFSNEMVVYDTETDKVVETDIQNMETNSNLSFAEKRELDRIKKENIKRDRIEAEKEAERIEAQIKEEIRIAAIEAQRAAAEKDKQERIARAKIMAEKLRLEKEAIYVAENERIAAENTRIKKAQLEEEKAHAQEQEAERLAIIKENQERIEFERLAQIEIDKQERINKEQLALAEAEKQATATAEKQAMEKERLDRITLAQQTAERLRQEKEIAENTKNERINAENLRIKEIELVEERAPTNEKQELIENNQTAQIAQNHSNKDTDILNALEIQKQKVVAERLKRIASAQETAKRLRLEQKEAEIEQLKANRIEKERLENIKQAENTIATIQQEKEVTYTNQSENEEISIADANQRTIAQQEREARIALAKKTAEKLRNEQIEAEKESLKRKLLQQEREKRIADAEINTEKLRLENEIIAEQTNLADLKDVVDKERNERIRQAKATAEKLRQEQIEVSKTLIQDNEINEERLLKIEESEKNLQILEQEIIAQQLIEKENLDEDALAQRMQMEEERATRIAQAKATAKKLRNEQIEADKARLIAEILKTEREKDIVEAQKIVQTFEKETLKIAESASEQEIEAEQTEKNIADKIVTVSNELNKTEQPKYTIKESVIAEQNNIESNSDNNINKSENTELEQKELVEQTDFTNLDSDRCARDINGVIQSSSSHKTLAGATVDMYFDGQNIESTTTDEKGEFHFYNVDCDTKYTLISFKKDFNNIAKADINTESVPDLIVMLLDPDPEIIIEEKGLVVVEQPIAETQLNVINNEVSNPTTKKKTIPIQKENSIIKQSEQNEKIAIVEKEIPKEEAPVIKEGKILINPIYFDLDEHYLTLPARRELDKIIVTLRQNPTMIIESGSHTDTRGPFDYNLTLSEKRSQETVGYLIANGADPDRISGRGYGESMPVNHCFDGVKCSDSQHLENRRTEFIILRY